MAVKRFIEAQVQPGEKYDYTVVREKFNKVLAKDENKRLRGFRLILEKINNSYKQMDLKEGGDVSDWYIEKLREFIAKYRQTHYEKSSLSSKSAKDFTNTGTMRTDQITPKYYNRRIPGVPMRGHYYQEASTDEFGCVIVCGSDDE